VRKLILSLVLCASIAFAAPIYTSVTLESAGTLANGSISPYSLFINYAGQDFQTLCIDSADSVYVGEAWNADLFSFTSLATESVYWKSNPNYQTDYLEDLYLFTQATSPFVTPTQQTNIQYTAWNIFNPGSAPTNSATATYLAQAESAVSLGLPGINLANYWLVESPSGQESPTGGPAQAFIVQFANNQKLNPTPEPSTFAYIGCSLIGLGMLWRKRHIA